MSASAPPPPPMAVVRAVTAATTLLGQARRALTPPQLTLLEMTSISFFVSNAVLAAVKLGVPEALKDGPRSAPDVAAAIRADAESLGRLLRALASVGLLDEADGRYELNRVSRFLLPETPGSMAPLLHFAGEDWHYRAWGGLAESVRTGQSAASLAFGMPLFDYLARDDEANRTFNAAMKSFSAQTAAAVLGAYDLSSAAKIVDIGGGHAQFLSMALAQHPNLKGVLFDLPHVVEGAPATLAEAGCAARVQIVAGSFFDDPIPPGADVYTLMNILHDWSDADALRILARCREALPASGKLLVVEMVLPDDNAPYFGTLFDLEMLVLFPGGRERPRKQWEELFRSAGLRIARVVPTVSPSFVMEVVRA